jgi:hypothetical protein
MMFVFVIDVLRQRHIEHRHRRPGQTPPGELRVPHDPDNPEGAGVLGKIEAEVLSERIFAGLEKRFTKAWLTIATGAAVSLSALVKSAPAARPYRNSEDSRRLPGPRRPLPHRSSSVPDGPTRE